MIRENGMTRRVSVKEKESRKKKSQRRDEERNRKGRATKE
jgi:hypothetical protein